MKGMGLAIGVATALAVLPGCHGRGEEQVAPMATAAPATPTNAAPALPTATPDHVVITFAEAEPDSGPAPLMVRFAVWDPF
jgi:hypothetical protein